MVENGANHELSPREVSVIRLAAEGLTDTAIAHRLGISESTVSTYWARIRGKYGPHPRAEIVADFIHEEGRRELEHLRQRYVSVLAKIQHLTDQVLPHEDEGLFRAVIEGAADPILLIDSEGTILVANAAANEFFGYQGRQLQGLSLDTLVPHDQRERHREHVSAFLITPRAGRMGEHLDTPAVRHDGEKVPVAVDLSIVQHESGSVVVAIVRRACKP